MKKAPLAKENFSFRFIKINIDHEGDFLIFFIFRLFFFSKNPHQFQYSWG
ncbi:MAG: hypothetical protein JST47_11825 [Bacteroidetes bacterium]|nr:hypothetical protein [Bacteroidota bacterium]MBS1975123.1 hypothetical protein [Bacteroidota bacterium]